MPAITRRKFLKVSAIVAGTTTTAVATDGLLIEPNAVRLVQLELRLSRLPQAWDGVRIAQLSDFHYDQHFSVHPIREAVNMVNGLNPDLVVLTGDFITRPFLTSYRHPGKKFVRAIEPCASLLGQLRSRLGVFACLGNHDVAGHSDANAIHIGEVLSASGIRVLRNQTFPLEQSGTRLWLAGLDDVMEGRPQLKETLSMVPSGETTILLVHEPDFADDVRKFPVDLQLSGHSHGGQIRVPFLGAPYLPDLAQNYPMGLYRLGSLVLYTNVGLGTIRLPIRFDCPPEVTLFTLRSN